jgi:ATP-dependent 26S proteasome regulatory subunit
MQAFSDSLAHLLAEMERIDLLMRFQVARQRKLSGEDEQFRGLYIQEHEVDALLQKPIGVPQWFAAGPEWPAGPASELGMLEQCIEQRRQASLGQGIELRLERLRQLFELDRFDIDVLLVCLAVEFDLRYEKLYAYLQDDVSKKRPGVGLIFNLLAPSLELSIEARRHFRAEAPLLRFHLVEMLEDPAQPRSPLPSRYLKADDRIVQYLLGTDGLDERIRPFVEHVDSRGGPEPEPLELDEDVRQGLIGFAAIASESRPVVLHLQGGSSLDKLRMAEALCHCRNQFLLMVDLERVAVESDIEFDKTLALIHREARLEDAALFWKGAHSLNTDPRRSAFLIFMESLKRGCPISFVDGETALNPADAPPGTIYHAVTLARPGFIQRGRIWRSALAAGKADIGRGDIDELAVKFKFSQSEIHGVVATAANLARWRDPDKPRITSRELYEACRLHSNQKLSMLAHKIKSRYSWNDIVLPQDRTEQLREICNHVKYRDRVYSDWGFDRKLAMGKGLCVLFAGPSGTGKTMAADIIAGELGLDLYKIDLSTVVSKYIGETEKNLSRIFDEAETSNAILFFDEADALFGKRSEVKDSHDRYANIETGYLLQRMEEHEGIVILASNFRKNMDEAFVRRLHFTVEFPFPTEEDRNRIWESVWPEATPRDPGMDLKFLARRFQITGGNIRNIALSAAFLAADDDGIVGMRHLVRATQREYQKMGKLVPESDFANPFKDLVAIGDV